MPPLGPELLRRLAELVFEASDIQSFAIRTPKNGINPARSQGAPSGIPLLRLKFWLAALIIAVVLALVAGIVARFTFDAFFWFGLVVAIAVGVWWMILPFFEGEEDISRRSGTLKQLRRFTAS